VQHLLLSDDGSRAIGIAYRDRVRRLVRIDIVKRAASYWCDAEFTVHATNFDGSTWCVADHPGDIYIIDTLAPKFDALWRIPDLDGTVLAVRRNALDHLLYVVTGKESQLTLWTFSQPSCVLRSKEIFTVSPAGPTSMPPEIVYRELLDRRAIFISDSGQLYEHTWLLLLDWQYKSIACRLVPEGSTLSRQALDSPMLFGILRHESVTRDWIAAPVWHAWKDDYNIELFMSDLRSGACALRLRMRGAHNLTWRIAGNHLICADNLGRVLVLDARTNRVLRDFRI